MIKKVLYFFAFAIVIQTIAGCVDCNCGLIKKLYFTKNGLSLKNLDASLPQPMLSNATAISNVNYGIQLQFLCPKGIPVEAQLSN